MRSGCLMTLYQELLAEADRLAARLAQRYGRHITCRPGCSGCCHHNLAVFEVEAAAVRVALLQLSREMQTVVVGQASGVPAACPLLVDDRCAIYRSRPLICRTQGLPLLIETEDGTRGVDFCPLNFTLPGATDDLDEHYLVSLEAVNRKLVWANLHHCRNAGVALASAGARRTISDLVLEAGRA